MRGVEHDGRYALLGSKFSTRRRLDFVRRARRDVDEVLDVAVVVLGWTGVEETGGLAGSDVECEAQGCRCHIGVVFGGMLLLLRLRGAVVLRCRGFPLLSGILLPPGLWALTLCAAAWTPALVCSMITQPTVCARRLPL